MEWIRWAAELAEDLVAPLGQRWEHTKAVATRAAEIGQALKLKDAEVLVAAGWLHDIGYAKRLGRTDFHPLDGAEYLRELGEERLACLVANHGGAAEEAELRDLAVQLAVFQPEGSLLSCALDYCDLTVGPDGEAMSPTERLADVEGRYGAEHVVTRGLLAAWPRLERRLTEVTGQLPAGGPHSDQPK